MRDVPNEISDINAMPKNMLTVPAAPEIILFTFSWEPLTAKGTLNTIVITDMDNTVPTPNSSK